MIRQRDFVAAVLDPALPAPAGLTAPTGTPARKRFDVYRNNVVVSLTEALETGFPVVRKLVGEAWFRAMAGVFVRAHPPENPLMMHYGAALPDFLAGFPPAERLPYLPDVARLELALRQAYHAADAAPIDPAALAAVPPERLDGLRLHLAPALRVLHSRYPVHAIWLANTDPDAPKPAGGPQTVLITRPAFDPRAEAIGAAEARFVEALSKGLPLGAAAEAGADPGFDLTAALSRLLAANAIIHIEEGTAP